MASIWQQVAVIWKDHFIAKVKMDKKLNVTHQLICWVMFIHTWLWKNVFFFFPLKKLLGIPWWSSGYRILLPLEGTQVQSLVRELGSHKPCGQKKKKRIESNFLKKLLALMIHFIKTFLAAPQGMWDLGVPPPTQPPWPSPLQQEPREVKFLYAIIFWFDFVDNKISCVLGNASFSL